jgi:DNA repair protein RadC
VPRPRSAPRQAHLLTPEPSELLHLARENLALLTELAAHYEVARLGPPTPVRTVHNPEDVVTYLGPEMVDLAHEQLRVVSLDTRNQIMAVSLVYQGGVNCVNVRIADCFRDAVRLGAVSVVLVHNHPSGDPSVSQEDQSLSADAVKAGALLGIRVVDHIVVARQGHVSLARQHLLPPCPADPA